MASANPPVKHMPTAPTPGPPHSLGGPGGPAPGASRSPGAWSAARRPGTPWRRTPARWTARRPRRSISAPGSPNRWGRKTVWPSVDHPAGEAGDRGRDAGHLGHHDDRGALALPVDRPFLAAEGEGRPGKSSSRSRRHRVTLAGPMSCRSGRPRRGHDCPSAAPVSPTATVPLHRAGLPPARTPTTLRPLARKAEDIGVSVLTVADHLDDQLAPDRGAHGRRGRHHHPAGRLAGVRERLPAPGGAGQGGGHDRRAVRRAPGVRPGCRAG